MRKTVSSEPLESFEYYPQGDGTAIVLLHDNIEYVEAREGCEGYWQADEVVTTTPLGEDEVAASFDELWVRGETEAKPVGQRLAELEELVDATMAVVLGEE